MITFSYNLDCKEIILVPISDTHIGSPQFQEHCLKEVIDFIKDTPNAYCVLNGDIVDMCLPDSVGSADIYDQISPDVAVSMACLLFNPIKDKILCVTEGNHEYRQTKLTMISPLMQFCTYLGIPDKFSPNGAYLFLRLKQRSQTTKVFRVYITHGVSNSSVVGGKIKKLCDYANMIDADCYIVGHSHLPATLKQDYIMANSEAKRLFTTTRLFVNSCAYLSSMGGYGERKGYVPATISQPKIYLRLKRIYKDKGTDNIVKDMVCTI